MKTNRPLLLTIGTLALPLTASAAIIGTDDFTYTDGLAAGTSGGTGWSWKRDTQDQTNPGPTAWEDAFGTAPTIASNALLTDEGGELRKYGGNEGDGAVSASGQLFYKFTMKRSSAATWGGVSSFDFATEKIKFGATGGDDLPAIEVQNTGGGQDGTTFGTVAYVDDQTYTLVCVIDYENNLLGLFVDPDVTDYWTSSALNSADVTRAYDSGNWSSSVRPASGGLVTWDDLTVATAPSDVGLQDFVDADGDGLPADWENANGFDDSDDGSGDINNGPNGNPDTDGLTNREEYDGLGIAEFDGGTDPRVSDTDGDTLFDGPEVLTHMTDPLDQDSDDDEIRDDEELVAGADTYVTDPNVADTDGGGADDGTEVSLGTDPTTGNGGDDPATNGNMASIGIEMFDYEDGSVDGLAGGDGFDFDNQNDTDPNTGDEFTGHTGIPADWDTLWGDPQVVCQRLRTQESGALRQFDGLTEGNAATSSEASGAVMVTPLGTQANSAFWIKFDMIRSPGAFWSGLSLYSYGTETAFIGVPGAQAANDELGFEAPGASQSQPLVTFTDGVAGTIVARIDVVAGTIDIYADPNLAGAEPNPFSDADILASFVGSSDITSLRCASGGSGPTDWDNICVAATWAGLSTLPADSDVDGLRDSFEAGFSVSDASSTAEDTDGFTALQEQTNGTSPNLADSDGDGRDDDLEVAGTGNSFPNPATDPCDPDSDDDGINDGDEITGAANTVDGAPTDPNVADTDIDGFDDLTEIQVGTDPNDNASNPTALGIVIVDGSLDVLYGAAATVQTINTGFNNNELDAAYTYVKDGKLYLMITGNLEGNFNKMEIFFDTGNAITTNVFTSAGNDGAGNMDGMTFDAGFGPEFHMILRRGWAGTNLFDLDIADLVTPDSNFYGSLFGDSQTGSGTTGTGTVNANPIGVAHDDSNTAGIVEDGSGTAADQVAAAAVTTGIELCIDLDDLGSPSNFMKIMVIINNDQHNFLSNQTLAGLPVGTGNLGGDGAGNFTGNAAGVDFTAFAGNQFFVIGLPAGLGIELVSYDGTTMVVDVTGTEVGKTYDITSSTTMTGFTPTGITFTDATATGISIPANATTTPIQFFRAEEQ